MIKVTFLGTNGWYDTNTGNTTSIFIETDREYIILDAGFGFYKVRDIVKDGKPVYLFISHMHLDHLIGLHTLPLFALAQGIDIYLPKGMLKILKGLLKRPLTSPLLLLKTRIRFRELTPKTQPAALLESVRLQHSVPCYGYRFRLEGKEVSYCTDTGLCKGLKRLAKSADLLMTECSMAPDEDKPNIFHITPQTAAKVALEAGAKKLALFHFDPAKYPTFESRKSAEDAAGKIFTDTIAANDGVAITL